MVEKLIWIANSDSLPAALSVSLLVSLLVALPVSPSLHQAIAAFVLGASEFERDESEHQCRL